jgi:beta-xylosidase
MFQEKKLLPLVTIFLFLQGCAGQDDSVYLFSYFTGGGETGLHLAFSYDGLTWERLNQGKPVLIPEAGKDKLMRDPCIIKGPDGIFHMVWTTGWWDKYIGYAWSENLVHWSEQKVIPVMQDEPEAKNCWAPEIFYDHDKGKYYIFWATTIPGRHSYVAESEREKGLNHRIYATSTEDFETFEPTWLFFYPGFSVIDATILEQDGKYIMFLKNENPNPPEKNIRFTISSSPAGPYPVNVSEPITGEYWAEGPSALRVGNYVYVYFDKYREHRYGAVRSADLVHWEDVSYSISFPGDTKHGTAFTVSGVIFDGLISALSKTTQ